MKPENTLLHGTWVSDLTHPLHLGQGNPDVSKIKIEFDELHFDNRQLITVTALSGKREKILYKGNYSIITKVPDEYIFVIEDRMDREVKVYARGFKQKDGRERFLADIKEPDFGIIEMFRN